MQKNKHFLNGFDFSNQEKQKIIQIVFCLNNQFIVLVHIVQNQYEDKNKFAELKNLETNNLNFSSFRLKLQSGLILFSLGLAYYISSSYGQKPKQFINKPVTPPVAFESRITNRRLHKKIDEPVFESSPIYSPGRFIGKKLPQTQKSLAFASTSSKFILDESNPQPVNLTKILKLNYLKKAFIASVNSLKLKNKFLYSSLYDDRLALRSDWVGTTNRLNLPLDFGAAAQTHFKSIAFIGKPIYSPSLHSWGFNFLNLAKIELSNQVVFSTPPLYFSSQTQPFYLLLTFQHPSTNPLAKSVNAWGELRFGLNEKGESNSSLRFDANSFLFSIDLNCFFSEEADQNQVVGTDQNQVVKKFLTKHIKAPYARTGFDLVPQDNANVIRSRVSNEMTKLNNSQLDLDVIYSATGELKKITSKYKPINKPVKPKMETLQVKNHLNNELKHQKLHSEMVLGGTGLAFIVGSLFLPNNERYLKNTFQTVGVICLLTTSVIASEIIETSSNTAGQAITQQVIDPVFDKLKFVLTEVQRNPIVNAFVLTALYDALKRSELFNDLNKLKSFCQLSFQGGDDWFGSPSDFINQPWDPDPDSYQTELTLNTVCYGSTNHPISTTFAKNIYPQVKNVQLKNVPKKAFFNRFLFL